MMVAMAKDIRVLLIKLADRLHNMRTLFALSRQKQQQIATETLEIYAPLARRLGVDRIKWELEDLSFHTLHPRRFEEIKNLVEKRDGERQELVDRVTADVGGKLAEVKIKAEVEGRPKHLYSIYEKMVLRGKEFNEIYDLIGIRVVVETVRDCYGGAGRAARAVEARPRPVQGLHRDAQVQHVPVAAHDGGRARGPQRRDPDPHQGDAPHRGVRHRRALAVQGGQGRSRATAPTWPGSAACSSGSRRWPTRASSWRA